jgi:hypothetical protein
MDSEDKFYILKKMQMELQDEINKYNAKKELYELMVDMMIKNNYHCTQERFLLSDLHKLINYFISKCDIGYIKLRDVDSELALNLEKDKF